MITKEYTDHHAAITKALIKDSARPVWRVTDNITGESSFLLEGGGIVEYSGDTINEIRTNVGWSVLHHAINSNDVALIKRILDLNVDINATDKKGWTPLHHAAWIGSSAAVRLLGEYAPQLDALSLQEKLTPLHVTVAMDTPKAAEALLSLGAGVEVCSLHGIRPLHLCAMQGRESIIKLLLAYNADVNALEANEATALHAACYYGHKGIASILLQGGANIEIVDLRGNTPLSLAKQSGHNSIIALLSQHAPARAANSLFMRPFQYLFGCG